MQLNHSWLALLGAVSLSLLPMVSAETQMANPNEAVIRDFNVVLTDNTKLYDLSCCQGVPGELPTLDGSYHCFPHQAMQMGNAPGSRRVGIQYCHHLPGKTQADVKKQFEDACKTATGEVLTVEKGFCPQIWPNYDDKYKKPTPPSPNPEPKPEPKPDPAPNQDGRNTNDKEGFKTEGVFHYALVDYAITRSIACCRKSNKPIVYPAKYKCAQRKMSNTVFLKQCAKILPTITKAKQVTGVSIIGEGGEIVDDATKQQCSSMWTNAVSYTYGFCQLDFDFAADEASKSFGDDCTNKGGELKEPHNGLCLWNVDDAAGDGGSSES
ncbi:uncharacterized protein UTRI_00805_B [Ustilago trichophora]|uniref:Uncharacterized protein n=1 Tax=Ustilago trichophora TaxID=86804 RepID=A0A5C3DQ78_9BASI|nr:uncharacterized protein UTRI_00805_B [Ustilago trichophora]